MRYAFILFAASALAQEPAPTFTTTTRLVELSVSVTTANGQPVTGLSKDDFTLTAAGRQRPIAFLQFDGLSGVPRNLAPLPRYVFTNRAEYLPSIARNVTAIVIDTLNSSATDDVRLRAHLLAYLKKLPPGSRVALYQLTSRLRVLHDFTEDPEALRSRIASINLQRLPGAEEDLASLRADAQSLLNVLGNSAPQWQETLDRLLYAEREQAARVQADRMEMAFTSMMALAKHLSTVPGRKNLIWAGGGLPLIQVTGHLAPGPHNATRNFEDWIQHAARRLAAANVVLYYYDTRGVIAPGNYGAPTQIHQSIPESIRITQDARIGTTLLAKLTGGRYVNYSNNVATALETAEADQRAGYTLAFYAEPTPGEDWIPLAVKVNRPGARAQHRQGYRLDPEPQASAWNDASLRAALANPLGYASVLLNARCEPDPEAAPAGFRLFLQVDAETVTFQPSGGSRSGSLDVAVAELTADGKIFPHRETARLNVRDADWPRTLREGIPYLRRWKPRPDAVRIRILVRDSTSGQLGSIDMPLKEVRTASPM